MKTTDRNNLDATDVREAARESKQIIRDDASAAKSEVKQEYREFKNIMRESDILDRSDLKVAKEAKKYSLEEIKNDKRDGLDSIDDIHKEYLVGNVSASKTIARMEDVVDETVLDMERDIF